MTAYTDYQLNAIFAKAVPVAGTPNLAIDCDGRFIMRSEYGKLGQYGWQVDHIVMTALGGADTPSNWRPRHWRGNTMAGGLLGTAIQEVAKWSR